MKLTVPRKELAAALAVVKGAVLTKSNLPVLHNVALTARETSLELAATDLDLCIRTRIDCAVRKSGALTVSASLLHGLVNSFTGEDVQLELAKTVLQVTCGSSDYKLGVLDIEEFPPATRLEEPKEFRLTQAALHTLLASTAFAIGNDPARYILAGASFKLNGTVQVACTDGRRLAFNAMDAEDKLPKGEVVLPSRMVRELLRLIPQDEEKRVTVALGKNALRVTFGDTTITSKVIEGDYPNYRQVIPEWKERDSVSIARADLLAALDRVALMSEDCVLRFAGQMLTVEARGKDVGEAVETLLIPKVSRKQSISFRCRYLQDALANVSADQVRFYAEDNKSPGVLKTDNEWLAVIMPLRAIEAEEAAQAAQAAQARAAEQAQAQTPKADQSAAE